jgi:hypothetical protein
MVAENLEKEIQKLVDIEHIKRMHIGYVYALASQQWDKMLDCFTEDAVTDLWNHGLCRGKTEIEAQFKGNLANIVKPTDGHFIGQPIIDVHGDKAEGQWIMFIFIPDSDRTFVQGKYNAEYIRLNGEWKFNKLIFICPWPEPERDSQ